MKKQMNLLKLSGVAGLLALVSVGCASGDAGRADVSGDERITVSALSFSPETRPTQLNKWPIEWNLRSIDTYTFVVPADNAGSAAMTDMDVDTSRHSGLDVGATANVGGASASANLDADTDIGADADLNARAGRTGADANFNADLPEGSVFVEAAGAEGSATGGRRVIQHSPFTR